MDMQEILDIIKSFFDAIIKIFSALFKKEEETTAPAEQ